MKKFVVFVLLVSSILSADPILAPYINEFQVSPDSLQRIEVAYYAGYQGIIVITNTCSTYVDSPLISNEFAVIDMENTNGNLDLSDTCDTIIVFFEDLWWADTVIYPADCLFAPEPYTSASTFEYYYDWYIDSTPTFGAENDDYPYCTISGAVFNSDSDPLEGVEVQALHWYPPVCLTDSTDEYGMYLFTGLLPGTYTLTTSCSGYQPDTTQVSTYALCPAEDINFYLIPAPGISETVSEISADLFVYPNPFRGKTVISYSLFVNGDDASRSTPYALRIFDVAGRLVRTFPLPSSPFTHRSSVVWDGRDDRGINVPPGVYFVKWIDSSRVNSTLICKLR
ncbi:carboxypeptidase regulatory-like domain-containing protein [candidate division WOR-3 bacterium]|nr:carboxypeptidase regulatory-like domain-containing protein [candidate division WOR-3 bacterium]